MAEFRLAAAAEAQLGALLAQPADDPARRHRAARLVAAMQDVADNLRRPAIVWHAIPGGRIGVYPVMHGRERAGAPADPAGEAGHYLVLRAAPDGVVDVLGIIPEPDLDRRALRRTLRANPASG